MAGFFGFFDYTKPGKGVRKDEPDKTGVALYLEIFFKRFWKLVSLNIFYLIASIPAIIIGWYISTYFLAFSAAYAGLNLEETATSLTILGIMMTVVLLQVCGSGAATTAMSYVVRKYVNDTHSWVWADFVDNIKSNFVQGTIVYVINILITVMCLFSILFYTFVLKVSFAPIMKVLVLVILCVFSAMQMYTYQLMAGFELKVRHIYKNSLLLTLAKLPWNVLTVAVTLFIMYGCYSLGMYTPVAGAVILGALYFTFIPFTQIFMTNNIVKKYILNPFMEENASDEEEREEAAFEDVG